MLSRLLLACLLLTGFAERLPAQKPRATLTVEAPAVDHITVYRRGALVTRSGTVDLGSAEATVAFAGLETGIDASSIQLKLDRGAAVLSLTAAVASDAELPLPDSLRVLRKRTDSIAVAIAELEAEKAGYVAERALLAANQTLAAAEGFTAAQLAAAADLYRGRTVTLTRGISDLDRALAALSELRTRTDARAEAIRTTERRAVSTIRAQIIAEAPGATAFELSYLVADAGWDAEYDLFVDTEAETYLTLLGRVYQRTGIDWTQANLTLSTGDPKRQLRAPSLQRRNVGSAGAQGQQGYSRIGTYDPRPQVVSGEVRDVDGEPLIGVNLVVAGTNIGTVTDLDGRYRLELPDGRDGQLQLVASYLGYTPLRRIVNSPQIDFFLSSDGVSLNEVVVGYSGNGLDRLLQGRVLGVAVNNDKPAPPPVTFAEEVDQLTARAYPLSRPLSVPADGSARAVRLVSSPVRLDLRYRISPKLDATAYLEGLATGWDTLGLTAGAVRLHLDGRYLGKDYLRLSAKRDTLAFALGPDDRLIVQRQRLAQESDRKVLRARTEYDLGYRITLRNTLRRAAAVVIEDQIPVSTRDEVEVELQSATGAPSVDAEEGLLEWRLSLAPAETKVLEVRYGVSAPKEVAVSFE